MKNNCDGCGGKCGGKKGTGHALKSHFGGGETRLEVFEGRNYLVVPVVMAKAGVVMNGSLTAEEELTPEGWNGRPVTVGHPQTADGYVTANSPAELTDWCVGRLFNTSVVEGTLKSEAWIDVVKANRVYPGLITRIKSGSPMDVSTGFFATDTEETGTSLGKEYSVISRNWIPDHLALLPDEQGACNWRDGCGVRPNKARSPGMKIKAKIGAVVQDILAAAGLKVNATQAKQVEVALLAKLNERGDENDPKQIIADLISSDAAPFTPSDADALSMMSAESLTALKDQYLSGAVEEEEPEVEAEGEKEPDGDEVMAAAADGKDKEKPMKDCKSKANAKAGAPALTASDIASIVQMEVGKALAVHKTAIDAASKVANAHRSTLVAKVVANSSMTKADAEKLDLTTLELFANSLQPTANYGAAAVARFNDDDGADAADMLPPSSLSVMKARRGGKRNAQKEMN